MSALSPDALAVAPATRELTVPVHIEFGEYPSNGSVFRMPHGCSISLSFARYGESLHDRIDVAHWMTPARALEIAAALTAQARAALASQGDAA